ncbi:hypothetical protein DYU05_06660 [Mucilaginibacter terrenus]|uniref:Uncharacterized protein n=1 Tax=Mucilaginibacter terrenus TaxID=2482727 RepID=A0A3E2NW86_9SPHI|nr:hypothetical protein [Mucilaginibacter terrenus]RFZ85275.1 hypothetical protein DYU05_06660 [Mucilaginibacter terrenus]
MNDLRDINLLKTSELFVTRHKWFSPYFELTDGQFIYARMRYKGYWKRYAIIETADNTWTIKMKGWFNRSLLLNQGEDQTIGTITPSNWKRDIKVQTDNGFEATYQYKKLFSKTLTLRNDQFGDIMQLVQRVWGFKKPFEVKIEPQHLKNNLPLPLPLLAFIGINIVLIRQARAAAAAAS